MDPAADSVDIACITGVPEGGEVAEVGTGGEEELEGDVLWGWRVINEDVGLIVGSNGGA